MFWSNVELAVSYVYPIFLQRVRLNSVKIARVSNLYSLTLSSTKQQQSVTPCSLVSGCNLMMGPSSCYPKVLEYYIYCLAISLPITTLFLCNNFPLLEDNASHLRMAFILASSTVLLCIITQIISLLTPTSGSGMKFEKTFRHRLHGL
jgi:hypothetical protein